MTEWDKEMEKRILRKSRFTLTVRILRILLIVGLLYGIYILTLDFTADRISNSGETDFYTKVALDWKAPNLRGIGFFEEEDLTLFGTKTLSYSLYKNVGRGQVNAGKAVVTKKLFGNGSHIQYDLSEEEQLNRFSFYYPEHPRTGTELNGDIYTDVWATLDMLHEGIVAELAFSTDRFLSPEELIVQLQPYDIDILWMPLHTGEFESFEPFWGSGYESMEVYRPIGISGYRTVSDDYNSSSMDHLLQQHSIRKSQEMMLQYMGELLSEKKPAYYHQFLGLSYLEERYEYLNENGFITYGAVVTGPVKELLKLQDEEMIRGAQMGEVELWNWEIRTIGDEE